MNDDAFLDWLDEQDGYYIADQLVRDEWPEFYDEYDLGGVTFKMDGDSVMVPRRDYRHAVVYGYPLD